MTTDVIYIAINQKSQFSGYDFIIIHVLITLQPGISCNAYKSRIIEEFVFKEMLYSRREMLRSMILRFSSRIDHKVLVLSGKDNWIIIDLSF